MTNADRSSIGRATASDGGCPAEVVRRVATYFHRSPETIRYTLKQFEREHPQDLVFRDAKSPLTDELRDKIFEGFRRGESVDALAQRFGRTRNSVYRVVNEVRASHIAALPLDFMPHEDFRKPGAEAEILRDLPARGLRSPQPAPRRAPSLPRRVVRRALVTTRGRTAPVPQVQFPEVPGIQTTRAFGTVERPP